MTLGGDGKEKVGNNNSLAFADAWCAESLISSFSSALSGRRDNTIERIKDGKKGILLCKIADPRLFSRNFEALA